MSTKLNVETFIAVLRKSGLVVRDRLEEAITEWNASGNVSDDPGPLVEKLVAANLITRWQAEKLLQGKHRGYFLGKYKLMSLLGKGGMSSVYLAEHLLMRRRCALKVLPAKRVDDSSYLERFHREAQAVALLDHPNIVRAYDVDHQNDGDRQIHFLVMEHVDGSSLQELVADKGLMSFLDAAEYTRQAASGLQDAHDHGMVHRDIKPGNLLVDQSGVVKILDLGLARFFTSDEGNEALTIRHDEKVLGTADYLAPEQALDSHTVDARADIYSLGCTLYFMLTGQPPFTEGTLAQRLMAHQIKTPPAVESLRPDIPASLAAIIRKMMEKKADDRYPTAGDVEQTLFHWIDENADVNWRSAHSSVYGSRVSHSDVARKAVPIAQPIVAQPVAPVPAVTTTASAPTTIAPPRTTSAKPASSKTVLPKSPSPATGDTQAAVNDFFSTLTQSNQVRKPAPKSTLKAQATAESKSESITEIKKSTSPDLKPVKPVSNPVIIIPEEPPPKAAVPEQVTSPAPISTPIAASTAEPPPAFPSFDSFEYSPQDVAKAHAAAKPTTSVSAAVPRPSTKTITSSMKAMTQLWLSKLNSLPLAVWGGIAVAVAMVTLLGSLYAFGIFTTPAGQKREVIMTPFPNDKREVTVGRDKAEYASIRDALIAVRNRFRPNFGNSDRFVIRIAAGKYEERIRIDGKGKPWPEGIVLRGDGDVVVEATGDEPVMRLANISRFTIENIQIDAKDKPVAMELADDLHESKLSKITVRGFTGVGILCKGAQGLSFGNGQFLLEQLSFEPAGNQAVGIKLEEGVDNDANSIIIRNCRFLEPMAAGIVIQGREPYGIEVCESIFCRTSDGIRFDGQPKLKAIHIRNNSFRQTKAGIRFTKQPAEWTSDIVLRRNLFSSTEQAEAVVQDGYSESQFRAMVLSAPPGIGENWSDRTKPSTPVKGEITILFENGGRQGEQGFAFASTDPKSPKFLAPTEKSPQRDVASPQPAEKKWVGAIGP